jgi:hypothetical protein
MEELNIKTLASIKSNFTELVCFLFADSACKLVHLYFRQLEKVWK